MAALARHEITTQRSGCAGAGGRLYPIIVDGDEDVRVALVLLPAPPCAGDRFEVAGRSWTVVKAGDHTRGAVAVPLAPVPS